MGISVIIKPFILQSSVGLSEPEIELYLNFSFRARFVSGMHQKQYLKDTRKLLLDIPS